MAVGAQGVLCDGHMQWVVLCMAMGADGVLCEAVPAGSQGGQQALLRSQADSGEHGTADGTFGDAPCHMSVP